MAEITPADLQSLTADIVAAYVSHNEVAGEELAKLIGDTYQALNTAGAPEVEEPEVAKPDKAAVRKSVTPDYLVSFVDGKHYKSLKRHLNNNGMTPDEYRSRFGLPKDYPMVAPAYSAQRSELARTLGLGRRSPPLQQAEPAPQPQEEAPAEPAKKGRRKQPAG